MNVILIKTLQLLLCLSLLVVLHEGGHFGFAKLFKTRVTRFYMFANWGFHLFSTYDNWFRRLMGKPLITKRGDEGQNFPQWLRNQWYRLTGRKDKMQTEHIGNKEYDPEAGTEYGIGWLPIGGYVAIAGMIDETNQKLEGEAKPWEFRSKKVWQRFLIMAGGVLMNLLTAFVIYSGIMYHYGRDYVPMESVKQGFAFNQTAEQMGFRDGDIPVAIDGKDIEKWNGNVFALYQDMSNAHRITVVREGQRLDIQMPEEGLNLLTMMSEQPVFMAPLIPAVIDQVEEGSPAQKAGMKKGTRVLAVDGVAISTKNDYDSLFLRRQDVLSMKGCTHADSMDMRQMTFVFQTAKDAAPDTVTLQLDEHYKAGIIYTYDYEVRHQDYSFLASVPEGLRMGWDQLTGYIDQLKYIPTKEGVEGVGSFIAIGNMFPDTWDWLRFWTMTALISIVLAVMNILPIPGLDGGHIVLLLYEAVTGRQPSERVMQWLEYIGLGIILALMVLAFGNDIRRIVLPWLFK